METLNNSIEKVSVQREVAQDIVPVEVTTDENNGATIPALPTDMSIERDEPIKPELKIVGTDISVGFAILPDSEKADERILLVKGKAGKQELPTVA